MSMEETCIVKKILSMQIKQNREEMVVPFAEMCYIDVQKFEVTCMIPVELREGFLHFALSTLQILELMEKAFVELLRDEQSDYTCPHAKMSMSFRKDEWMWLLASQF
ncbi:hypothetical protein AQUCO_01700660v1 [Aquilegia coerulea]|uniref:Uncharacterized protein n=1 Tax=Aquilegia coerulea TaxID=218851 RepID=A0A2G5DP56_AQUCA|nr:hypothetical protein AQUCO_01700660v1 [Aquilegia coerulea]PIA45270.1 hypothetical protein AQUCO_01700660v1 [Aquilegia coerulea]PIA45271.1 hypothetical protein AQUCO_01700660v1 [Aquilegia coerulea]